MTNRLALILGALVAVAIALDYSFGWGAAVFAGQKALVLMEQVAIWR